MKAATLLAQVNGFPDKQSATTWAEIIDRETGLPELLEACKAALGGLYYFIRSLRGTTRPCSYAKR